MLADSLETLKPSDSRVTVLHKFEYAQCDIWFMRFSMDYYQKVPKSHVLRSLCTDSGTTIRGGGGGGLEEAMGLGDVWVVTQGKGWGDLSF